VDVIGEGVYSVAENLKKIDLLQNELTRLKKDVAKKNDFSELKAAVQQERDELSIQLSEHKAQGQCVMFKAPLQYPVLYASVTSTPDVVVVLSFLFLPPFVDS